jgi:hypothetical protein
MLVFAVKKCQYNLQMNNVKLKRNLYKGFVHILNKAVVSERLLKKPIKAFLIFYIAIFFTK